MKFIDYTATQSDEGRRLSSVLKDRLHASSTLIKINKKRDGNLLNGASAFSDRIVHAGDTVSLRIDDESEKTHRKTSLFSDSFDIPILYEDDYMIIIDKPAGIEIHPSALCTGVSLSELMSGCFGEGEGFHAVNRLDRGTSGIMAVAKTGYMHSLLIPLLHTDSFIRRYLAVVDGVPSPKKGEITLPISRDPDSAIKRKISPDGLKSRTSYEVLSRACGRSLVSLTAHTGRTHQLRLHMSAIGCPITGDWLYGTEDRALIQRPALHSSSIQLIHPLSGARISLQTALPRDIASLLLSPPQPRR